MLIRVRNYDLRIWDREDFRHIHYHHSRNDSRIHLTNPLTSPSINPSSSISSNHSGSHSSSRSSNYTNNHSIIRPSTYSNNHSSKHPSSHLNTYVHTCSTLCNFPFHNASSIHPSRIPTESQHPYNVIISEIDFFPWPIALFRYYNRCMSLKSTGCSEVKNASSLP